MTARTPRAGQADFCQFCGCGGSYPNCPTREAAETCPWWSAGDRSAFDLIQEGIARRRLEAAALEMLAALKGALKLLNHMGDVLNGIDAVTTEDVEMATPIFKAIRDALALADPARPQDDEVRP